MCVRAWTRLSSSWIAAESIPALLLLYTVARSFFFPIHSRLYFFIFFAEHYYYNIIFPRHWLSFIFHALLTVASFVVHQGSGRLLKIYRSCSNKQCFEGFVHMIIPSVFGLYFEDPWTTQPFLVYARWSDAGKVLSGYRLNFIPSRRQDIWGLPALDNYN